MRIRVLFCVLLLCNNVVVQSQTKRVIVNTPDAMYELTGAGGTCTYAALPDFCPGFNENIYSSALYNQTLYFITFNSNNLYSVQAGVPGSCRFITRFPSSNPALFSSVNALTVDKKQVNKWRFLGVLGRCKSVREATKSIMRFNQLKGFLIKCCTTCIFASRFFGQ